MNIFQSFLAFIKKPSPLTGESLKPSKNLALAIVAFMAIFMVSLLTSIIRYHLIGNDELLTNKFRSRNVAPDFLLNVLIILYGPIFEELAFRLGLRFSKMNLIVSLSLIITEITKMILGHFDSFNQYVTWTSYFLFDLFTFLIVFAIIYGLLWKHIEVFFTRIYSQSFGWVIYTMAVFFALLHLNNYVFQEFTFDIFFSLAIIVFVQFLRALILSFVRLRSGIAWCRARYYLILL